MISESYSCLRDFQQLTSLTISEGVVSNLGVSRGLIKYLPGLEEISIHFSIIKNDQDILYVDSDDDAIQEPEPSPSPLINNQNSLSAMTTTDIATQRATTYLRVHSMRLYGYTILTFDQRDDILHIKRFDNLKYLYISLSPAVVGAAKISDLVDNTMLEYVHRMIPSYEITVYAKLEDDACQYLDLYYDGLKDVQDDSISNNNQRFSLHISFYEIEIEKGNSYYDNYNTCTFKRMTGNNSPTTIADGGEIFCCMGAGDTTTRLANAQRLLRCRNDLVTETTLDLTQYVDEGGIGSYITGIKDYNGCQKLCINGGYFDIPPAAATVVDDFSVSSNSHNISQLEFKSCTFPRNILSRISTHYPYFNTLKFIECCSEEDYLPAKTAIELPNTAIDTLILLESYQSRLDYGLVYDIANSKGTVFISIDSADQNFSRKYICTSCSNGSKAIGISSEMFELLKNSMDDELASFITIKVKSLKKLVLQIDHDGSSSDNHLYFDICISLPQ